MDIFVFFIVVFVSNLCKGEMPASTCGTLKPFKTKDNSCDNFTNVCVKKNDRDCESFLGICAQCPATNYSVLMFHDFTVIKVELQSTKDNIKKTTVDMKETKEKLNSITNTIYILLWVTIAINILLFVILILEVRFKIITKLTKYGKVKTGKRRKYLFLESRKSVREKVKDDSSNEKTEKFQKYLNSKIDVKLDQIIELLQKSTNETHQKNKFRIDGRAIPIELRVEKFDTIVQVKKQICAELPQYKSDDYKIMKLKYNGKLLDDNEYLSTLEIPFNDEICCEFDKSMDASNIVVVKLVGNMSLPQIIQILKSQTILHLKEIISRFHKNAENFKVFVEHKENKDRKELKEVMNEMKIEECKLLDDECVQIISKEFEELVITSIFDDRVSIVIEYSNIDSVLILKSTAAKKFNCKSDDLVLFLHNKILDEIKYSFEYFTESSEYVKFCKLTELDDIEIEGKPLTQGCFSDLFKGKFIKKDMDILIKKYKILSTEKFKDSTHILNELTTFQITKYHPRFVQLFGVFKGEEFIYVAMENMAEGSLKMFLKKNFPVNGKDIAKWSFQILEGFKFLHESEIIHRDLNPSSVLLDSSINIKLSSFNLSKYSEFHKPSSINVKGDQRGGLPVRYLAPEIIKSETYDVQTDVWSFGAIMVKIATNKNPYSGKNKNQLIKEIIESDYKDYKCSDIRPGELQKFIESCMKGNPKERATVENLLKDEFIKIFYDVK